MSIEDKRQFIESLQRDLVVCPLCQPLKVTLVKEELEKHLHRGVHSNALVRAITPLNKISVVRENEKPNSKVIVLKHKKYGKRVFL